MMPACSSQVYNRNDEPKRSLTRHEKRFLSLDYELLYRVKELPKAIAKFLNERAPGIANPGEPFNSTDVITPSLPLTQLSWAGISKDFGFVLYKQGGFAPHQVLLLIEIEKGEITRSSTLIIPYYMVDIGSLKNYILTGEAVILNKKE